MVNFTPVMVSVSLKKAGIDDFEGKFQAVKTIKNLSASFLEWLSPVCNVRVKI